MEIESHETKLNALFLGYLTRKFKRNYPIHESCNSCDKPIKGLIHRYEHTSNNKALIMYKSENNDDKGMSSFSYYPISLAFASNNKHYCNYCYNQHKDLYSCCICLNTITKQISTKCDHSFCNNCLMKWVKHENKDNVIFNTTCPLCRSDI
jgi:hypothetical protein